jgi:hypothetical protein
MLNLPLAAVENDRVKNHFTLEHRILCGKLDAETSTFPEFG